MSATLAGTKCELCHALQLQEELLIKKDSQLKFISQYQPTVTSYGSEFQLKTTVRSERGHHPSIDNAEMHLRKGGGSANNYI